MHTKTIYTQLISLGKTHPTQLGDSMEYALYVNIYRKWWGKVVVDKSILFRENWSTLWKDLSNGNLVDVGMLRPLQTVMSAQEHFKNLYLDGTICKT